MGSSDNSRESLRWLADGIVRHLVQRVSAYHLKSEPEPTEYFEGLNETALVVLMGKIFEGLGYAVEYEQNVYATARLRLDLWAGDPADQSEWLVEAKVLWDNDNRLNRTRFYDSQEVLGDFLRLAECSRDQAVRTAAWVAFSAHRSIQRVGEEYATFGLGDAVDAVKSQCRQAELDIHRTIDLRRFGPCENNSRFAHVLCWTLA